MNKLNKINSIRNSLKGGLPVIGSWMQIPHGSIAEIMGASGYQWVAIDMEHGSISTSQLPDLFRALELGDTLPLVRLQAPEERLCKLALDAGASGVIAPQIESAKQLLSIRNACSWPMVGARGVGFSRANLFGRKFEAYKEEAKHPLLIAMIETQKGASDIREILKVPGLDAIFIGPYDLSASLGVIGDFNHPLFKDALRLILDECKMAGIPSGIHVIKPIKDELNLRISEGYQFIAYSIDAVFLWESSEYKAELL